MEELFAILGALFLAFVGTMALAVIWGVLDGSLLDDRDDGPSDDDLDL